MCVDYGIEHHVYVLKEKLDLSVIKVCFLQLSMVNLWSWHGVAQVLKVKARHRYVCYLFHGQCTCQCIIVTVSISEQDFLKHRNHCYIFTGSYCSSQRRMCVITYLPMQVGLLPGLPFTMGKIKRRKVYEKSE